MEDGQWKAAEQELKCWCRRDLPEGAVWKPGVLSAGTSGPEDGVIH